MKWRRIGEDVVEIVHNKRRGLKLKLTIGYSIYPCHYCCLIQNKNICGGKEGTLCGKVNPSGYRYFLKIR